MTIQMDTVKINIESNIAKIILNRPDSLNAMNEQMYLDLNSSFNSLWEEQKKDNSSIRVVTIEGSGDDAFSVGADIKDFSNDYPSSFNLIDFRNIIKLFPAPVVAKIDGYCLGGGFETALACDFRLASEESTFGLTEIDLGLLPGAGGIHYLTQLTNSSVAKQIAMSGEQLSAKELKDTHIINAVYSNEEFDQSAYDFVRKIAKKPPLAIRCIKESARIGKTSEFEGSRTYDRQAFHFLSQTEDHKNALDMFDKNSKPTFTGE